MEKGLFERIYDATCRIPKGRVATYGQIALLAGNPRAARAVGWALHQNPRPGQIPCHRVVNRRGECAPGFVFGGEGAQRALLEAEGIVFLPDARVDLACFLWDGK
jgi:methylated-DNA-protein-cysteine methyltransferase-like protein